MVDDDPRVLEMLRDAMSAFGYEVDVADDGQTGLAKFRQRPADVVITDLTMRGWMAFSLPPNFVVRILPCRSF